MNPITSPMQSVPALSRPEPRLVSAAHEFEASLLQELVKPLEHDALSGSAEDDSQGSNETLMSFGSQALAKAISEHGGLGIARQVLTHFAAAGAGTRPQPGRF